MFPYRLFGAHHLSPESLSYIETFLRQQVREEVNRKVEAYCNLLSSSSSQLNDDQIEEEAVLNLRFVNKIPSTIFTTNNIEAENGQLLQVELCDNSMNNMVQKHHPHPLSSALIEFVVLDGDFGSRHRDDGTTHWTVSDFNKSVVAQREWKRPLIVGPDRRVRLENGVAFINHLSFTDNSNWTRSKQFRLGVRIIDEEILAKYPRIGEAVSKPFRVKDHRGDVNKKHHPPEGEDEVWRLEGIGKNGVYHKRLSSQGIESVDSFVKAYKINPHSLQMLLGKNVSEKKWKAMVKNALEYNPPSALSDPSFEQIWEENDHGPGSETFFDGIPNCVMNLLEI